jgi:hypothetical protein
MPWFLLVLGFSLVGVGLWMGWVGKGESGASGGAGEKFSVSGPSWLILVVLGVLVIGGGVWKFADSEPAPEPAPTTTTTSTTTTTTLEPDIGFPAYPVFDWPFAYGDDIYLDQLYDECAIGFGESCDQLFYESPVDSDYEWFSATCGGSEFWQPGTCAGTFVVP